MILIRRDLFQLGYHHSLPFIGFGFLDNFVMILAGKSLFISLNQSMDHLNAKTRD